MKYPIKNIYEIQLLPHNYIAEEILLGIILIYPSVFPTIKSMINTEYFFLEYHQTIYTKVFYGYKQNKLNIVDLIYSLSSTGNSYILKGCSKIIELMKQSQIFIPSSNEQITIYTQEILKLIQYTYIRRVMIQYAYDIIRLCYNLKISHHLIYNKAAYYLNIAEQKIPNNKSKSFQDLLSELLLKIRYSQKKYILQYPKYKNNKQSIIQHNTDNKINSGLKNLDQLVQEFKSGDLIVIAGRPSIGKTSLAINIAYNITQTSKRGICIFSLEMSSQQIIYKLISVASNVSINKLLKHEQNKSWYALKQIYQKLFHANIYIDDNPNTSIDYIEYTSKFLKKEYKTISLILIDYLQLIQSNYTNSNQRSQEISYITRKLKLLSQYLYLPIIILSQLNRSIENRSNKKPILSDLRESGCIDLEINFEIYQKNLNELSIINFTQNIHDSLNAKYINNLDICELKHFNKKFKYISKLYKKNEIYLFLQYVFKYIINKNTIIKSTHNHKYLSNNIWTKMNYIIDETIITKKKLIIINNLIETLYNCYTKQIHVGNYVKTYDINTYQYFNFICNTVIVHNSIEQDADIVIMIHKEFNNTGISKENQVIDLLLLKNRNGPTGECKLIFWPNTTKFQNIISANNNKACNTSID
uniref:DNA 5'-3' helicase n=1 Tax=Nitophyllum punctatum TaxID=158729 RepID=A0A4D6WYS8_9FLOR|nr:replication helicase subunit [Nitophyllum punctatum]